MSITIEGTPAQPQHANSNESDDAELLQEPLLQVQASSTTSTNSNDDKNMTVRLPSCCGRPARVIVSMNHNVLLNLLLCVTYGISDSLWSGTVIAAYLKKLGHGHNTWVGNVEAANGLAGLFTALPVGYLADTLGRDKVLAFGGVLLIATALLHAGLLEWIGTNEASLHPHAEILLALIMAMWGIGGGIVMGPSQALFADSVPAGKRSQYYLYLFVCFEVASCLGPLVSIILFQTLGDDWDLYDLRLIIYVGLALEVGNGFLMMFFDDSKALDEQQQQQQQADDATSTELPLLLEDNNNCDSLTACDEERPTHSAATAATDTTRTVMETNSRGTTESHPTDTTITERQKWIPYILFCHSLVFALGSGMTVNFFPLFFKDEVGMSPTQVQVVYLIVPLVLAACGGLGQFISTRGGLGRVPTGLLFKLLGITGLFSMVFFKKYLDKHPFLLVPIYIARTALMNASYPLEESILMDFVPKHERARWKSLESIAVVGWCGSAALGGWASDKAHGDYTVTFLITACIQLVGCLFWAILLPLVPIEEGTTGQEQPSTSVAESGYQAPQLNGTTTYLDDMDDGPGEEAIALAARFPPLSPQDCFRFMDEFEGDNLIRKLQEYIEFREMYNLDALKDDADFLERPTDDAADWKWASEMAIQAAKTCEGSLVPGVMGYTLANRVCKWDSLPQMIFAPRYEDDTVVCAVNGNPIMTYLSARLDLDAVSPDVHALAIALYLERRSYTHGLDTQGAILLVDTRKGKGWPNPSVFSVVGFLQILASSLHKTHPGRVEKLVFWPVPPVGTYAFKMMKGWLPKEISDGIFLIKGPDGIDDPPPRERLAPYVSSEVVDRMEETRRAQFVQ
jgi:MFS family permease